MGGREVIKNQDIFIAEISNKKDPEHDGFQLKSVSNALCWGCNQQSTLPVRVIQTTQGEDGIVVVPADSSSVERDSTYTEIVVECRRSSCDDTIYLPEKYKSNPTFCSVECIKKARNGSDHEETQKVIDERHKQTSSQKNGEEIVEIGNKSVAEVHKFSSSNSNAIIKKAESSINIGPIDKEAFHEQIPVAFLNNDSNFAICLNREYWPNNYLSKMEDMIPNKKLPPEDKIPEADEVVSETGDNDDQENGGADLTKLRAEAKKEATEAPEITQSVQSTSEYSRSDTIREYVMSRANGKCEGCEKPAPFTSKTGQPYLHAHHVYELSNGGSDTPDTVIALCPNCHYRVHHGEDGDEYNQTLIDKLKQIE